MMVEELNSVVDDLRILETICEDANELFAAQLLLLVRNYLREVPADSDEFVLKLASPQQIVQFLRSRP